MLASPRHWQSPPASPAPPTLFFLLTKPFRGKFVSCDAPHLPTLPKIAKLRHSWCRAPLSSRHGECRGPRKALIVGSIVLIEHAYMVTNRTFNFLHCRVFTIASLSPRRVEWVPHSSSAAGHIEVWGAGAALGGEVTYKVTLQLHIVSLATPRSETSGPHGQEIGHDLAVVMIQCGDPAHDVVHLPAVLSAFKSYQ